MRHLFICRCMALVMGLIMVLGAASAAMGHAQLLSTDPADNAILAAPPAAASLVFNEPVSPLVISLVGPGGVATDLLSTTTGSENITISLPADLASGTHVLSWRVVSTDGHPVAGATTFSIGSTSATPTAPGFDPSVAVTFWAGKTLLLLALLLGVGAVVFDMITPLLPGSHRLTVAMATAGLVLAALTLGLQGLDALGLPLTALVESRVWATGMATSYGATSVALVIAFTLTLLSRWFPQRPTRTSLAAFAALFGALAFALSGHAGAANPQWLTRPAVFVHIVSLLFWVGALLPLSWLLARSTPAADRALGWFSRIIPFAVAALLASGVTLATIQLGAPGPLWLSPYGFILAAKLIAVLLLLVLALYNRVRLTAPALTGNVQAGRRLRQSIAVELVLVVLILGLVAGWRFTPPPRALAEVWTPAAEPVMTHLMANKVMAMVQVTPGQPGPVALQIAVMTPDGAPLAAQSVAVSLSEPALGIEALHRDATGGDGSWQVSDFTIPVAGTWQMALTIRLSRFEQIGLQGEITIPRAH